MYPAGGALLLPNQLVEGTVIENPEEPVVKEPLPIPPLKGRGCDVGSLASQMLGIGYASDKAVQFWTTVAGGYNHRNAYVLAEGFEDLNTEILKVRNQIFRNGIVKAVGLGG